ncbi:MAG: aspartate kinase [Calditrichia bacterium]
MALVVQKYGGSSLATPEHFKRVAAHVVKEKEKGNQVVVVVSALGETTDHLVELAHQVCDHPPEREMDMLLSVGERISIALLAMAIHQLGYQAISFTGSQVGIITDNKHTEARILEVRATRLLEQLEQGKIVIVAGFQGVSINKEITTLGRGGSDTTAIALAAALKADRCEIMKDVEGIYVAEPKIIPDVRVNEHLSYDEMIEMSAMGAGVLKTEAIEVAKTHQIKIAVGSSFTGKIGTIVTDRSLEGAHISGIVGQKDLCFLTLECENWESVYDLNLQLAQHRIKVPLYTHFGNRSFLLIPHAELSHLQDVITQLQNRDIIFHIHRAENRGIVAIIGTGLNYNSELSKQIFAVLRENRITPEAFQMSQLRVSIALPEKEIDETIKLLYRELIEKKREKKTEFI